MRVDEVTARSSDFLDYLTQDRWRNAFALHDLIHDAGRTRCFAASENRSFQGYLLVWTGRRDPSVIVHGSAEAARALLDHAPSGPCTFLVYAPIGAAVERARRIMEKHPMSFMVVDAASVRTTTGGRATPLRAADGPALTALYDEVGRGDAMGDATWIERGLAYGIFEGPRLISVAGVHYFSGDHCLLGGVYTARDCRGRGCATEVTSAVTREALGRAPTVALNVVSTNGPAVHIYEKLGYRPAAAWTWMDAGTGRSPLM